MGSVALSWPYRPSYTSSTSNCPLNSSTARSWNAATSTSRLNSRIPSSTVVSSNFGRWKVSRAASAARVSGILNRRTNATTFSLVERAYCTPPWRSGSTTTSTGMCRCWRGWRRSDYEGTSPSATWPSRTSPFTQALARRQAPTPTSRSRGTRSSNGISKRFGRWSGTNDAFRARETVPHPTFPRCPSAPVFVGFWSHERETASVRQFRPEGARGRTVDQRGSRRTGQAAER